MTKKPPIACSLDAAALRQRLDEIADLGATSLVESGVDGERHLLRFRSGAGTRRRLEAIIAAEATCCSFLDLSLEERGDQLVLSVCAPEDGRQLALEFAAAFTAKSVSPPGTD